VNVSHSCCPLNNLTPERKTGVCVQYQELIEKTGNIINFNIKAL
jgi:hypothetical protein